MNVSITSTPQQITLRFQGRFDFEARRDFDAACQKAIADAAPHILLQLAEVDYMDSSALGMLLVLRDKALSTGKRVTLGESRGLVRKILEVANFHKIFDGE